MEAQPLAVQLRAKRVEMMLTELEQVALRLFDERGFTEVTVDEIAVNAAVSVRTFYRYFPAKEDVLQLRIDRRTDALRTALAQRPGDEPLLESLRAAVTGEIAAGDTELLRVWMQVIGATPSVLKSVIGGLHLKMYQAIADFFALRLDVPSDDLVPTMLAAAAGGVLQAAHTTWFLHGGDLADTVTRSLDVLNQGIGTGTTPGAWAGRQPEATAVR